MTSVGTDEPFFPLNLLWGELLPHAYMALYM